MFRHIKFISKCKSKIVEAERDKLFNMYKKIKTEKEILENKQNEFNMTHNQLNKSEISKELLEDYLDKLNIIDTNKKSTTSPLNNIQKYTLIGHTLYINKTILNQIEEDVYLLYDDSKPSNYFKYFLMIFFSLFFIKIKLEQKKENKRKHISNGLLISGFFIICFIHRSFLKNSAKMIKLYSNDNSVCLENKLGRKVIIDIGNVVVFDSKRQNIFDIMIFNKDIGKMQNYMLNKDAVINFDIINILSNESCKNVKIID
jgi:hypothetical protein